MATQPLYSRYATVTLDGSGNGTAQLGPVRVREHWQLSGASVAVATHTLEATCKLYLGSAVAPGTFIGQTATGSSGDTCALGGQDIQPGMYIWAVWTGGDVGAQATVTAIGTYSLGAPR